MPARPGAHHHVSLITEVDIFDHRGAQTEQPRPYLAHAHVVSAPFASSRREAGNLGWSGVRDPSGAHLTHGNSRSAYIARRMAAGVTRLRSVLASPDAYWLFQRALGATAVHQRVVTTHARVAPGARVLDIGCGPGRVLDVLPTVEYVGIDHSSPYIEAARQRYSSRATFVRADAERADLTGERPFDVALALGVLHHLDDESARQVVALAARSLAPDGRLVTLDPGIVRGQPPLARWLVRQDRGLHPRAPGDYRSLVEHDFETVTTQVTHDLARIPYTHIVLECRRPCTTRIQAAR